MTRRQRIKRRLMMAVWRLMNPLARPLAGWAPWWVVLETTGRRTGLPRRTPLAAGPVEEGAMWLIAVHGEHSTWVANIRARPHVRLRARGRWTDGVATVVPYDPERARRFNLYSRLGPRTVGIDPTLVRIQLGGSD